MYIVSKGIDIGNETIVVATPSGTTRYGNAVRNLNGGDGVDGDTLTVQTDSGTYAIGEFGSDRDSSTRPLIGPSAETDSDEDVMIAGIRTLLLDATDGQSSSGFEAVDLIGCVDRVSDVFTKLSRAERELDVAFKRVDPGMAVCYDAFGPSPTGLGVVISEGRAFATLAVEGIPVSTARIDYEDQWYDLADSVDAVDGEGPRSEWAQIRYGTLLADLAADVAGGAPSVGESTAVAIGGGAAPIEIPKPDADTIGEVLRTDVASTTIAETPAESPARGALVAVQDSEKQPGPVPAFAATDKYAPALADTGAAADAFDSAVDWRGSKSVSSGTESTSDLELSRAHRHRISLASTIDRLVDRFHEVDGTDQLEEFRAEVETAIADLETELADLERRASPEAAVDDLETSVVDIEEKVEEMAADIGALQAAIAGLDEDSFDNPDVADALGSAATDALQDDIDSVEEDLSSRIEGLWDEIDDINDRLVDVSGRINELPDIQGDLESTNESVRRLSGETADIRESIADLQRDIDAVDQQSATTDETQSIRSDIERISENLDQLRSEFRNVERVDPATVDQLQRDLDAIQETVVNHARRLEGVERTVSDLDDRIETAFQDTAKAEALSSLQGEVSQIGKNAAAATETANSAVEATDSLEDAAEALRDDTEQIRKMVDSLAESTVTRSEMEDSLVDLQDRIGHLESEQRALREQLSNQGAASRFTLQLIATGLASVGGLGAFLAFDLGLTAVSVAFLVLVTGPAAWLWLSASSR